MLWGARVNGEVYTWSQSKHNL